MADWTWKQAVADQVLEIVNRNKRTNFTLDDLYSQTDMFQRRFPQNRHIREKIRQTLQRLRSSGLISFLGGGNYELDVDFYDLELEPSQTDEESMQIPKIVSAVRQIRLRNSLLASDIKRRYDFCCQICQTAIELVHTKYAEAHHIRPLGSPHLGRDFEGNILVVCPNHHIMLDRGAISIDSKSLVVQHIHNAFEPRRLYLSEWHRLDGRSLAYYGQQIFGR